MIVLVGEGASGILAGNRKANGESRCPIWLSAYGLTKDPMVTSFPIFQGIWRLCEVVVSIRVQGRNKTTYVGRGSIRCAVRSSL